MKRTVLSHKKYLWLYLSGSILGLVLTVVLAADLLINSAVITRWSHRYSGTLTANPVENYIDMKFDDDHMEKRFCEWRFAEEEV